MDPNPNLKEQRDLARKILEASDRGEWPDPHDSLRLAELVEALDAWITSGGFLPSRWML